jgi:hypothetical protein
MTEAAGFPAGGDLDKGFGHAMQAEAMELVEGWVFEHDGLS